jgi:DegV family protein with EDD domain
MRIGLVVDASCDLPDSYLEANGIRVLPSILQLDGKTWMDDREPGQTMMLYRSFIADRALDGSSSACSAEEIRDIFLQEVVVDYDRVLVISAGTGLSNMFARATEASYAILQSYRERRGDGHRSGGFALRILDTGSVCAGEAILVSRALQLLSEGRLGFEGVRRALREEAGRTVCLVVPGDPWYLRHRGLDGHGTGMGRAEYALSAIADLKPVVELVDGRRRTIARARGFRQACALAFARAAEAIGRESGSPTLALSFGGDPRVIREMPAYQALDARAADARIELHLSVMSATMGARLGPGALSVAWLAPSAGG